MLGALLLAATGVLPSGAASPGAAAKLLERWNEIGRKLVAIAEDVPEERLSYRPQADARTLADQLLHAAGAMASFSDRVAGRAERYPCDPTDREIKLKADVAAFVRRSVAEGAELLRAAGDAGLERTLDDSTRLGDLANELVEHSGEHYGQLVVYYRINGLVPPESR